MHAALKEQIAGLERRLWLEGSEAFDKIMAPECFSYRKNKRPFHPSPTALDRS